MKKIMLIFLVILPLIGCGNHKRHNFVKNIADITTLTLDVPTADFNSGIKYYSISIYKNINYSISIISDSTCSIVMRVNSSDGLLLTETNTSELNFTPTEDGEYIISIIVSNYVNYTILIQILDLLPLDCLMKPSCFHQKLGQAAQFSWKTC